MVNKQIKLEAKVWQRLNDDDRYLLLYMIMNDDIPVGILNHE